MMNYVNLLICCLLIILVVIQIGNVTAIDAQKKHEKVLEDITTRLADRISAEFIKVCEDENARCMAEVGKIISQADSLYNMTTDVNFRLGSIEHRFKKIIKWMVELEEYYPLIDDSYNEIKNRNDDLFDKAELLNQEIQKGESAITKIVEYVDSLTRMGAYLNHQINSHPDGELPILSQKIEDCPIPVLARKILLSNGVLHVSDLIERSRETLSSYRGLGDQRIYMIENFMSANNIWYGMNVLNINGRWYKPGSVVEINKKVADGELDFTE